ncbi:hypothetical protein BC835DRAFT_1302901 [Cytidiella melzeri]|nr:hypothetical protein BC835DRAFT_1302901 [Cytidiella melzeri]
MASRGKMLAASRLTSDSLDLSKITSHSLSGNILSASITFLSLTDSVHSLQSTPSFPSVSGPPAFVALSAGKSFFDSPVTTLVNANTRTTIPTGPRMRCMLTEPITVARWAEGVTTSSSSNHVPWENVARDEVVPRKAWFPVGSLFSPEAFRAMLGSRRVSPSESWTVVIQAAVMEQEFLVDPADIGISPPKDVDMVIEPSTLVHDPPLDEPVPTIMLSNSTVAMPLSLESTQSVARATPAPLAVRRGRVQPPSLPLPSLPVPLTPDWHSSIPTPFRGSPGAYSPKFEFSQVDGDFSMDLEAMCQDLRSRCPPLAPPSPIMSTELRDLSDVSALLDCSADSDSDEWGFARGLLEAHIERSSAVHTPMRPTSGGLSDDAALDTPNSNMISDSSWGTEPTLTNSPQPSFQPEADLEEEDDSFKLVSTSPKQQRRRTVIIETPRNSTVGATRPVRVTIDLSHLADNEDAADVNAFETAASEIPFEPQPLMYSAVNPSTPHASYVRPISSASMGRPVRSILKTREKKSVRFSELPDTREYVVEAHELESVFEADEPGDEEGRYGGGGTKSTSRKRAATTPSANSSRKPTMTNVDLEGRRGSFPKHPAVRTLARISVPATPLYTASPTPPARGNKAAHQSMLLSRSTEKADIGRPKRLTGLPAVRSSLPADSSSGKSLRKKQAKEEKSWRKSGSSPPAGKGEPRPSSVQKSRMPFKSILTKLRS